MNFKAWKNSKRYKLTLEVNINPQGDNFSYPIETDYYECKRLTDNKNEIIEI